LTPTSKAASSQVAAVGFPCPTRDAFSERRSFCEETVNEVYVARQGDPLIADTRQSKEFNADSEPSFKKVSQSSGKSRRKAERFEFWFIKGEMR
jgi:hypothetical protein